MPSDKSTSPLTEEQRDEMLREVHSGMAETRQAAANFNLVTGQVDSHGRAIGVLQREVIALQEVVFGGVSLAERTPDHLSPPPPPFRGQMDTHDSIKATQGTTERIEDETKRQTAMLAENTAVTKEVVVATKQTNETQRKAAAALIGAVIIYMLQSCQPSMVQPWIQWLHPHAAATSAAPATPPAPSPAVNERKTP